MMAVSIGNRVYIAETASLIGDVTISDGVSIFDSAVIRGDQDSIFVGEDSNVQDNASIHSETGHPAKIGKRVSIGHNAIVHGATVNDNVIVGMGSIVLTGAIIASGTVIGAGAVVKEKFHSTPNSLLLGIPAREVRSGEEYLNYAIANAESYIHLREKYLKNEIDIIHGYDIRKNRKEF